MLTRTLVVVAAAIAIAGSPRPAAADDHERGQALYQLCSQCHGADGAGNREIEAPAIAGLPPWYVEAQLKKFRSGARGKHPEDLPGLRMRPMALWLASDPDVAAVSAYVGTLAPGSPAPTLSGGDPTRGATFYVVCTQCHGPDASGNPQLFAPPLRHASDWYLLAQLRKFRAGIRGANPADQTGALMRPMSLTLPDEQALLDVLAHIRTISR